jgi:putative addiction module component (TIGR02574 family)
MKLPKAQRILLVEQIWDSIAMQQKGPDLTPAQEAELDRRWKRLQKTGPLGDDWATVKKRILRAGKS